MAEMKPSGVQWIGLIPADKEFVRNKYYFHLTKGKIPSSQNSEGKGVPYVGASELDSNDYRNYTEDDTVPVCNENDVLILWDGARAGLVGTGKFGAISSTVVKCVFTNSIYPRFGYWYFKGFEPYFSEQVHGTTIPHMNARYIENIGFISWNKHEQQAIADYLDDRCSKIDEIIAEATASIEEYKELKQALIDKYTINNEYSLIKLKYITVRIGDGIHTTPQYNDEGTYQFINGGAFGNEKIKMNGNRITEKEYHYWNSAVLNLSTIMIALNGVNYGNTSLYQNEPILLGKSGGYITLKQGVNRKYIRYCLANSMCKEKIDLSLNGTTIPNLSLNTLRNLSVYLPPIDLQDLIAENLDLRVLNCDSLISEKQTLISDLQEYKKSLIYEVVTGKRRVV